MPLQIGDNSSEGWTGVQDLRVDGKTVRLVAMPVGASWLELWRRDPHVIEIDSSTTLLTPSWALYADVVIIGGGGGGAGGDGALAKSGNGGSAARYKSVTRIVQRGEALDFTIGIGGSGGRSEKASGARGGTTMFAHTDYSVGAIGGAGGTDVGGTSSGDDTGKYTRDGWEIMGAKGGIVGYPGEAPGAGGGGGPGGFFGKWKPGQAGGKGGAWVRFRSA